MRRGTGAILAGAILRGAPRSSHAACQSFFTVRRVGISAARRLTEAELIFTPLTHARSSGTIGGRSTCSRSSAPFVLVAFSTTAVSEAPEARGRFDGMLTRDDDDKFYATRCSIEHVGVSDEISVTRRRELVRSDAMSKRKVSEIFSSMAYGPAPEAADSAKAWIESHGGAFGHFINGAFVKPKGRKTYTSVDPCSGKALATTLVGENADIDEAVAAARAAYPSWSATPGHVRARHLYAVARCINKHHRLFAVLESMDNGKTIRETRDADLALVIRHFYHHAGWAQLFDKEMAGFAPVGVIGQVIPWNFPLLMLAWKIAPALAMGNTVVLKPAPYTSLTALLFCQVLAEAGVPAGVVNIVTGGAEPGGYLCTHPDVDKVAFTGSTRVGQLLRRETAGSGVKLSLELGGKSPTIVFDSADLDSAVEAIVSSIWFNQGQVCCAGSRLLVQENVSESLVAKLKWRLGKMRVGASLDKCMDSGAMVDRLQCDLDLDLARSSAHTPSRDTPHLSPAPSPPLPTGPIA